MKVVLYIFNLSDRLVRLLKIFTDKLSNRYNVEMLIKNFIYEQISKKISTKISS